MISVFLPLFAVHISDNTLTPAWQAGGFVATALLILIGTFRLREEEIPRIALLTAAFFVASSIHFKVGPTSVHLLLNGLMGVVLGRRAALAIAIGVFMQAVLLTHGGFGVMGVNCCIMTIPALVAWQIFAGLKHLAWRSLPVFRAVLVSLSVMAWLLCLVYSAILLLTNRLPTHELDATRANDWTFQPVTLAAILVLGVLAAWFERRLENAPEFPLGLLIGGLTVLDTLALNFIALTWGGIADWQSPALLVFLASLPLAVVEAFIVGSAVGFLARVKPELLGLWPTAEPGLHQPPSVHGVSRQVVAEEEAESSLGTPT